VFYVAKDQLRGVRHVPRSQDQLVWGAQTRTDSVKKHKLAALIAREEPVRYNLFLFGHLWKLGVEAEDGHGRS
jgi:hypothetical protein